MILMIYNSQVCKEFLLPNIYNADYQIRMYQDVFGLRKDVTVNLEVTKDGWHLHKSEAYDLKFQSVKKETHLLKGEDIIELKTKYKERMQVIAVDTGFTFHVMEKFDLRDMREVSIGKSEGNLIQYRFMGLVSSFHAMLHRHSDGWYLYDQSANGVFCEDRKVQEKHRLKFGDHMNVFGLHLLYLDDILAVGCNYGELYVKGDILRRYVIPEEACEEKTASKTVNEEPEYFNRSPRNLPVIYQEDVEIESPPPPKEAKEKPLFLMIGPSFTMAVPMILGCGFAIFGSRLSGRTSGAFMYTGIITAVSCALIGVMWAFLNLKYSRKEKEREEEVRFNAYSNYLIRIADSLREKYQHNAEALRQIYPSAEQCLRYSETNSALWNRNHTHTDFLFVRLGLGELPFQVRIQIPKERFTLQDDSLADKPKMILEEYQTLHQVPVGISLLDKQLIGIVGGRNRKGALELMHSMAASIAANHCYTDVKLVFIYREENRERINDWECMRWFPHVWSEDKQTRYMAANEAETGDIFFELANVLRNRSLDRKKSFPKPYYILFVSDPALLEGEILSKYIYQPQKEYGMTTVLMVETLEQLPNACEEVIEADSYFHGTYNLMDTAAERTKIQFDRVSRLQLEEMGRTLANIRVNEMESTSEIPASLDFFTMYQVNCLEEFQVADRWRKNRTFHSMKALIGKKPGNADCYLDIHEKYHGPHGLIAGTTGSGKSETLQTYMLSLALNFSPQDISFFIIDFKGGGMANLFSGLPHLAGQISNLSGNQVRRAMISIKSENMRRQKLFTEYGVNHIDLYTRLYKNKEAQIPIPHLFIIIDEFAELKKEEPDFMRELISVAQVGRSLGVHLILATQKPSGTVDDNIWSNSKFRLCLRVQDRQDSNDMLHKTDAAFITQAGRCYLQVGNDEIYELFQTGWSGAAYEEGWNQTSPAAALLTRTGKPALAGKRKRQKTEAGKKERTQLEAVVEYLSVTAREQGYEKTMQLWLPVLGRFIYLQDLHGYSGNIYGRGGWKEPEGKWTLDAFAGLYDDPENQAQRPLKISFSENGHHAVCGSAVSGKSTLLQTIVFSLVSTYTPQVLNLYILDFSSHMLAPFEHAPHVGGIVFDNQEDRLSKFTHMLSSMMDERKRKFQGGNYSQYVQGNGTDIPAVLVVIDNLAGLREKSGGKYDDLWQRLAREGVGYGIYLLVTAAGFGVGEIPSRMGDNIRMVLTLEQTDKFKYMEAMRVTRLPVLPEEDVRGRGLALVEGRILEFQAALAVEAEDDFARGQQITAYCKSMGQMWKGSKTRAIPEIPDHPVLSELTGKPEYQESMDTGDFLPFAYKMEDASVYSVHLEQTYCYTISGRSRCGKTNVLKMILHAAHISRGDICIMEFAQAELQNLAVEYGAQYISDEKEMFEYLKKLIPVFRERNQKKQIWQSEGKEESFIYQNMKKETPVYIFLSDLLAFFKKAYQAETGVGNMSGFLENIMEKGSLHGIYFFGCLSVEDQITLSAYRAYNSYVSYKKGIHLGGNLNQQKIFNFQNIPYASLGKPMKKGMGYVPDEEEETMGLQVVIPLAKKESQ